jgi:hypothetical protein
MKLFVFLAGLAAASAQDLSAVRTVYLMPMSGGVDQYLAVQLTANHVFWVVTDPRKADVVFTDRIGVNFEQALRELYGPEPTDQSAEEGKSADYDKPAMAPLSRGKGSFFLVDHKTHNVLWSTYVPHKNNGASELNRMAEKIVEQLGKDPNIKNRSDSPKPGNPGAATTPETR